jgi:hypothetical protein
MITTHRRIALGGLVLGVAALGTACQPDLGATASPTPCYVGDYTLDTQQLVKPVETSIGSESFWLLPGGSVTLSTTTGSWRLAVDEQVVAKGPFTGEASLHARASGTLSASDGTLTFSVNDLSGSGQVHGYERNRWVRHEVELPGSYLDGLAALQGQATYACSPAGLSLDFAALHLDLAATAAVPAS